MHQIRFRLGLRPRPRWESLHRSPDPLAGFRGPTSKGRRREGRGGKGKEMEGEGLKPPQSKFSGYVAEHYKYRHYYYYYYCVLKAVICPSV